MTREEKFERMLKCNHVFALIKDNGVIEDPIRECIRCGMTNKNEKDEKLLSLILNEDCLSDETKLYHQFMEKWEQTFIPFHQLSNEELGHNKAQLLYGMARKVNLSIDIEAKEAYPMIFKTMKDLVSIIDEGNYDLDQVDDIKAVMFIYNTRLQKTYKRGIR